MARWRPAAVISQCGRRGYQTAEGKAKGGHREAIANGNANGRQGRAGAESEVAAPRHPKLPVRAERRQTPSKHWTRRADGSFGKFTCSKILGPNPYGATKPTVQVKMFKNWPQDQAPHPPTGRSSTPKVAEGAGETLRAGPRGSMAGAGPGVDSTGIKPQRTNCPKTGPTGQTSRSRTKGNPGGHPQGRTRTRTGARDEWECHVEIEWITAQLPTPHSGGGGGGRGGGTGSKHQDSRGGVKRKCEVGYASSPDWL